MIFANNAYSGLIVFDGNAPVTSVKTQQDNSPPERTVMFGDGVSTTGPVEFVKHLHL